MRTRKFLKASNATPSKRSNSSTRLNNQRSGALHTVLIVVWSWDRAGGVEFVHQYGEDPVTHASRLTLSTILLSCLLSFAGAPSAYAQGLKTNSGNFGSGWQLGGASAGANAENADPSARTDLTGTPAPGDPGDNGYSGSYGSKRSPDSYGGSSGSYGGGYNGYNAATRPGPATNNAPASPDPASAYQPARSAGSGLRTQ